MVEISGLSNNIHDKKTSEKTQAKKSYDEFVKSAFDSYKEFKSQAQAEYDNFREEALKEFNNFKNDSLKSANEEYAEKLAEPWQEYEVHEGVNPPLMKKPKTPPIYKPDANGSVKETELDNITDQEPVYYEPQAKSDPEKSKTPAKSANEKYAEKLAEPWQEYEAHEGVNPPLMKKPKTPPVYKPDASGDVRETELDNDNVKPDVQKTVPDLKMVKISRQGVSGSYSLTAGENGKGFNLITDMKVTGFGEASKFFRINDNKGNGLYFDEKTKRYSFRGIEHPRLSFLHSRMDFTSQKISINNAIYNDLLTKQKSGTELTDAENLFIKSHLKDLQKFGLGVDNSGNLINISNEE